MESHNNMNHRIVTLLAVVGLAAFAGGCTVTTYPARPVYYEPAPPVVVYTPPPRPVIIRPAPPPYYGHCRVWHNGRCVRW